MHGCHSSKGSAEFGSVQSSTEQTTTHIQPPPDKKKEAHTARLWYATRHTIIVTCELRNCVHSLQIQFSKMINKKEKPDWSLGRIAGHTGYWLKIFVVFLKPSN